MKTTYEIAWIVTIFATACAIDNRHGAALGCMLFSVIIVVFARIDDESSRYTVECTHDNFNDDDDDICPDCGMTEAQIVSEENS